MNELFGTKHLLILAGCAVGIILGVLAVRKWPLNRLCRILLHIGVVSEVTKVIYYILANEEKMGGILPKSDLPFQLCSLQILFVLIVVCVQSQKVKDVLLSVMMPGCLVGGAAALLIATTSSLNGGWPISVQYFGYHGALVIFGVILLATDKVHFTVRHYVNCLKFMLGLFLLAVYVNSMVYDGSSNFNFMYVASPPAKGLPYLNEDKGWLVYIIRYAVLVVGCVTLCYISPIVKAIKAKLTGKANVPA